MSAAATIAAALGGGAHRPLWHVHAELDSLTSDEVAWFRRAGVPFLALARPHPVAAGAVAFCSPRRFAFTPDGERAVVLLVDDAGEAVDLAAWAPRSGRLGTWQGRAFALGQERIFDPTTYWNGGALRVHAEPLTWIRSGRDGIVILEPPRCYEFLAGRERLLFDDLEYAERVRQWCRPPAVRTQFLVDHSAVEVAA